MSSFLLRVCFLPALFALCRLACPVLAQSGAPALPELLDTAYVPPTGASITVAAGDNLQEALNRAHPGDEVVLEAGATFTGNFILPAKTGDGWITVRSSNMSGLPAPGIRVRPAHAGAMPKLLTPNSSSALKTAPGAHHYRIIGLEISVAPGVALNYSTVLVAGGDGGPPPSDIIFDRVYIHGSVLCHCKTGLTLNSRRTAVIDSYVSEYHSIDQDTQAILSYDGPGPFQIVNNYLEASGENIMFGGATPSVEGMVPSDLEFRLNHLSKPVRWRTSIIPKPQAVRAAGAEGGSLDAAATCYYQVVAIGPGDSVPNLASDPSDEIAITLGEGQRGVSLSWAPVLYGGAGDSRAATEYRVFRTSDSPAAKPRNWVYYRVPAGDQPAFIDSGAEGAAGTPGPGRRWLVKNLFELKNAQRVLVDGNLMEYCWQSGQNGFAILLTPRTQNGLAPWAVVQDVTFTNNLIRHAGGGASVLGKDDYCGPRPSLACRQSSRVLFRNNVFDDINRARWGGRGWVWQIVDADALTVDHNTGISDRAAVYLIGANRGITITNNILTVGVSGDGTLGSRSTFERYATDATLTGNVLVGALAKYYDPAGRNSFPASAAAVSFMDFPGGNYRLAPGSPFCKTAADEADPGADFVAVRKATAGVVLGVRSAAGVVQPAVSSVLNAASLSAPVAPGSLVSIFGINLAGDPFRAELDPLPRDLGGVSVTIGGLDAPLLLVNPGQIDAQIPFEIEPGDVIAVVTVADHPSEPFSFTVAPAAPGLYLSEPGRALAFHGDGTVNAPSSPAPGGTVVIVFLTGQGAVDPAVPTGEQAPAESPSVPRLPLTATLAGEPAQVIFAVLAAGFAGVLQVEVILPSMPPGDYPLVVTVGDVSSDPALVSIA